MTIGQFIRVCNSSKVKSARIFDNASKDFWDIKKMFFNKKTKSFYFNNADGVNQIEPVINTRDIFRIERVGTDDNEYLFIMQLKDGREYSIFLEMEVGYTPFLLKQEEVDNIKTVREAIPQYLDDLKGKQVGVYKTQYSQIFSVLDDDGDITSLCIERYVIKNFDYIVDVVSGFPLIKLIDKDNEDYQSTAFGVRLIDSTKYNIENGECSIEDRVIISADSGNYFLACED